MGSSDFYWSAVWLEKAQCQTSKTSQLFDADDKEVIKEPDY